MPHPLIEGGDSSVSGAEGAEVLEQPHGLVVFGGLLRLDQPVHLLPGGILAERATGQSKKDREREKRRVRRRRDRAEEAQALGRLIDDLGNDSALLRDPGVPAEDAAAAFDRLFAWHLPSRDIGEAIVESIGPERARAI